MNNDNSIYEKIDWPLLQEQKAALLALTPAVTDIELIEGLVGLIDSIQDDANDKGYPVYASRDEDID